ncbi:EAL domain-containing protein [Sulfurimonas sp. CS5]|uniref:two-component system response regulator n=1 Tax=Sulfurimonas sp. CS5 TaxID=3391145 RepID=UPI0039E784A5
MNKEHLQNLIKNTKKLNILYVEDDKIARDSTLRFLETFFLKIDTAFDGEHAYVKKSLKKYDIIITDINMPKLNGIELIKKIRENDASTPILILSAYDDRDYFIESIKFGVDGYILKPLELEQFYLIISKIVKRIELDKALLEYQHNLEKKVEEQIRDLRHKYYHEFYTDLPNSQKLQEDLLEKGFNYLLLLDISHFSTINKEYGRVFANNVLVRTARILEHHIHKKARLYKIESDRFVIVLKDASIESIHDYCKQIVAFFDNKNVKVDEAELNITFNIGVAKVQDDTTETLINSEYALDKSKSLGSRQYEIFDENISCFKDEKEAIRWLETTRTLILEDKIEAYFQPIQDTQTGEIFKYEVLARGIIDDRVIAPIFFIPPAEKLGLITSITKIIINKSFEFFQDKTHQFSINITERDLLEGYMVGFLNERMAMYNIIPSRVTFEILENITLIENNEKIIKQLNILREMGFKISIDDFGTENSNFSRLLEINLDFIKIDGLFIKNLKKDSRNKTITKAIVNLSKTLGVKTIAEFVEDEEIYNIIKECGIDYAQGYYIGKPEAVLIS